jgi:hypothetical protein
VLVYTKLKDDNDFPSYLDCEKVKDFLNRKSLNQLFLNVEVLNSLFTSTQLSLMELGQLDNDELIKKLNKEYNPQGYSRTIDYMYITNLERKPIGQSKDRLLGGFHNPSSPGGVMVKFKSTPYNECAEELLAHELGHWLGFPHTFKIGDNYSSQIFPVVAPQGGTNGKGNYFMDYDTQRKKWFKVQLEHSNRQ